MRLVRRFVGAHTRTPLRRSGPRPGLRPGRNNPASAARNSSSGPSSSTPPNNPSTPPATSPSPASPASSCPPPRRASPRLERLIARLPRRVQPYTRRLHDAPVSHVAAFLLLHELTAVVPLVGLFGLFHWGYLAAPFDWVMERYGDSVGEGGDRIERYFQRKGLFGFDRGGEGGSPSDASAAGAAPTIPATTTTAAAAIGGGGGEEAHGSPGKDELVRKWESADPRYRAVVEGALAYAITKALLPARVAVSLWATPWAARGLVRLRGLVGWKR